jgi:PilZ domain
LETTEPPQEVIKGKTVNLAKGGIGMLCDQLVPSGSVVRCEISLSHQIFPIPTLLRVRWSDLLDGKKRYRVGLQFLL